MPQIAVRVCSLSVASGIGEFDPAGLYVVVKIGRDAQRTRILDAHERDMAWDELFLFLLPATGAAPLGAGAGGGPHAPASGDRGGGAALLVSPAGAAAPFGPVSSKSVLPAPPGGGRSGSHNGSSSVFPSTVGWRGAAPPSPAADQSSAAFRGILPPPTAPRGAAAAASRPALLHTARQGGPPMVLLELWRWSEAADDCLGVYTLFGDDALGTCSGEVIDRKIAFNKSSSYSVSASLRVRLSASDFAANQEPRQGAADAWAAAAVDGASGGLAELNEDDFLEGGGGHRHPSAPGPPRLHHLPQPPGGPYSHAVFAAALARPDSPSADYGHGGGATDFRGPPDSVPPRGYGILPPPSRAGPRVGPPALAPAAADRGRRVVFEAPPLAGGQDGTFSYSSSYLLADRSGFGKAAGTAAGAADCGPGGLSCDEESFFTRGASRALLAEPPALPPGTGDAVGDGFTPGMSTASTRPFAGSAIFAKEHALGYPTPYGYSGASQLPCGGSGADGGGSRARAALLAPPVGLQAAGRVGAAPAPSKGPGSYDLYEGLFRA